MCLISKSKYLVHSQQKIKIRFLCHQDHEDDEDEIFVLRILEHKNEEEKLIIKKKSPGRKFWSLSSLASSRKKNVPDAKN